MTEDQLEQETLGWLADVGYTLAMAATWRTMAQRLNGQVTGT